MDENKKDNIIVENESNTDNTVIENGNNAENSEPVKKFNVFALLGLIVSLIGAVLALIYALGGVLNIGDAGFLVYLFLPCLIAGIALGIVGAVRSKKCRSGLVLSIAGIVIGALALLAFAGFFIIVIIILTSIGKG